MPSCRVPPRRAKSPVPAATYSLVEKPGSFPEFEIELKYFDGEPVIAEISRVSKPGRRVYSSIKDLKPAMVRRA